MRKRTVLAGASALALAAAAALHLRRGPGEGLPPRMDRTGEAEGGVLVRRRTVDYEALVHRALAERSSLIVMTVTDDVLRDRNLETSIRYTPSRRPARG